MFTPTSSLSPQEKDFIVTGGLLWWREYIIVGCFNLAALVDEVRIYPRTEKLDNANAKIFKVDTQVVLLNLLKNQARKEGRRNRAGFSACKIPSYYVQKIVV